MTDDVFSQGRLVASELLAERIRQVSVKGWTPDHDDDHADGSLAQAASAYALAVVGKGAAAQYLWPWDLKWWKPTDKRRSLVKAGALIIAEIERIDRLAAKK